MLGICQRNQKKGQTDKSIVQRSSFVIVVAPQAQSRAQARPCGDTGHSLRRVDTSTVQAFRLLVNRSVAWADWDEELLALELQEIQESDFDLSLTGFDPGEIDNLLALYDEERANATPPLPESPMSGPGDLRLLGPQRVLCGDATNSETASGS
jgi:hypothetical protein